MKPLNIITTLVAAALLVPSAAFAKTTTITLIELNDLHAHLVPHLDMVADGNGGTTLASRGGLTRIATLVKQIRADNPNSALMNIGDTFHGGAEAFFTIGNAIAGPLNALGIDVGVPGNWDYYYSPAMFRARFGQIDTTQFTGIGTDTVIVPFMASNIEIKRPNYVNLGANMADILDLLFPEDFLPATHMMDIDGIKVGFIGLTSDIVADMHDMLAQGFKFAHGITEHTALVNKHAADLRDQGADIVVVMSELGIHKTKDLADAVDSGIDVFFAAHTHEATFTPLNSASGALVVEAGNDGYLGRMDITVDKTRRGSSVTALNWTLLDVDDSVAEDPEMLALVNAERAQFFADDVALIAPPPFFIQTLNMPLDTVIGHTDTIIDRKNAFESTFNNALTDALRRETGTDVAFTPGFRMANAVAGTGYEFEDATFATGEVTMEDAFRFFPMLYGISTGETNGQHLRGIIENAMKRTFSSEAFNHLGGWNFGFSGLDMTIDLAAGDGQRIKSLTYSDTNAPVGLTDSITIAGCLRLPIDDADTLCAYPGFENVQPYTAPFLGQEATTLDLFVYMLGKDTFNGSRVSMTDISNTPMWPATEFIQPIDGVGPGAPAADGNDCGYFGFCDNPDDTSGFGGFSAFGFGGGSGGSGGRFGR
ncbi:MAG TPA: bifunctional metallophosphatase/5'-nucleotidase [Chromatiaceae bacterium]|jgi:2',3'-cyclic-nucleotide 2'-phosphodiesterase (5'-nucleotidase family)|nr:bifunctional metallophosphatase/5'-nucleotidase [Chromatiaceae bacterium]HIA08419.1 bifunctional metallophosphatase/5'-nucleotidase [Chromatiaceae bacterium]HIO55275.1 bifunctional metallophosphatase/5'-nucleotidase [Chromatiales bacterium]